MISRTDLTEMIVMLMTGKFMVLNFIIIIVEALIRHVDSVIKLLTVDFQM